MADGGPTVTGSSMTHCTGRKKFVDERAEIAGDRTRFRSLLFFYYFLSSFSIMISFRIRLSAERLLHNAIGSDCRRALLTAVNGE